MTVADAEKKLQEEHAKNNSQYSYDRAYAAELKKIPVEPKGAQFTMESISSAKAKAEASVDTSGDYYHRECGKTCFNDTGDPTQVSTIIDSVGNKCTKDNVNIIRVCESFATRAYLKNKASNSYVAPGKKYDGCGSLIWIGGNASPSNPNQITSWGDVDGTTGDDPVLPSVLWGDFQTFARDIKPPLFDQFTVVVVPDSGSGLPGAGNCFGGRDNHFLDEFVYSYGS